MGGRGGYSTVSQAGGVSQADIDDAVFEYTTSRYTTVNSALREGNSLSAADAELVSNLDEGIAQSTLAGGTTLYRGTSLEALGLSKDVSKMTSKEVKDLVGKSITDGAYMSTSTSASAANNFSGRGSDYRGSVNLVITSTSGKSGLSVGSNSNFGGAESEVILPRGTSLTITSAKKYLGKLTVYATY